MSEQQWHSLTPSEAAKALGTSAKDGLSAAQAAEKLAQVGPNQLAEEKPPTFLARLIAQLSDFLVLILIGAAAVSFVLGEYVDAIAIAAIVILNAVLGLIQESRAEEALASLKQLTAPHCRVVRDGSVQEIDSRDLVPGDVVLLDAGDPVPADLRLTEAVMLKIDEAPLTGESVPVDKEVDQVLKPETPLAERINLAFMGTSVTFGRGRGIVYATGMQTEVGHIAGNLQSQEQEKTPLQVHLDRFGKQLGIGMIVVCILVALLAFYRGMGWLEVLMVAVSLAVATIPEGLPAVVTIVLALGTQRMVKRQAVIRRLSAVETLGSTTVICSDKTGTLTQNRMTVTQCWTPAGHVEPSDAPAFLLTAAALCNDSTISDGENGPVYLGDPTETALVKAAKDAGLDKRKLEESYPRVAELPFSSDRKRMTTVHRFEDGAYTAVVKGAPDVVLARCKTIEVNGQVVSLDEKYVKQINEALHAMGERGLRNLAIAVRRMPELPSDLEELEQELTLIGIQGLTDPPRPEAAEAVKVARQAGMRTVMITGDHLDTALAIARQIGITSDRSRALSGPELDKLDQAGLNQAVLKTDVYARVSPEHKLRIVEALRNHGEIVAMTGDGVNDAPALKKADIGVAMGITGTGVAKGAADMILMDDNFATIVSAVEEGRTIYANIQKFAFFLLSSNIAELLIISFAMIMAMPIPLSPIHLLWLNLVTDSLPALALGMEPSEEGVMNRPPRPAKESVITSKLMTLMLTQTVILTVCVLLANWLGPKMALPHEDPIQVGRTLSFATLSLAELWWAHGCRSPYHTIGQLGFFTNRAMWGATVVGVVLVVGVIQTPFLQPIFDIAPLSWNAWLAVLILSFLPTLVMEPVKAILAKAWGMNSTKVSTAP